MAKQGHARAPCLSVPALWRHQTASDFTALRSPGELGGVPRRFSLPPFLVLHTKETAETGRGLASVQVKEAVRSLFFVTSIQRSLGLA